MNKTLLQVGQIFAIIMGVIWCITIVGIPFGVFNFIAANKFAQARDENPEVTKETITGWSIYLLFTTLIAGICGLIAANGQEVSNRPVTAESRLAELNKLYDRGIISKEEYQTRRQEILNNL